MSSKAFFRMVKCPSCDNDSVYSPENAFRPFCSERCKNNDFGAWANEEHRLSQAPSSEDLNDESLDLAPTQRPPHTPLQ